MVSIASFFLTLSKKCSVYAGKHTDNKEIQQLYGLNADMYARPVTNMVQ
jgi:hypothetical protein